MMSNLHSSASEKCHIHEIGLTVIFVSWQLQ